MGSNSVTLLTWKVGCLSMIIMALFFFGGTGRSLGDAVESQAEDQGSKFFTVVGEQQLTFEGWNGNPVWSPDGSQIAYVRGEERVKTVPPGAGGDIWVMNSDGTGHRALTTDGMHNRYPSWSLDGQRIIFSSHRSGKYEIWSMKNEGSDLRQLTKHEKSNIYPVRSPDGEKIAFASSRSGGTAIWLMNPDGTRVQRITPEGVGGYYASWNPTGRQLVFDSSKLAALGVWARLLSRWSSHDSIVFDLLNPRAGLSKHLWLLDLQGGETRQLTHGDSFNETPVWSPDGQFLAFSQRSTDIKLQGIPNGPSDIIIQHLASGTVQRLTMDPTEELYPNWSPDGQRLAIMSTKPNKSNIWVLTLKKAGTQ